MYLAQRPLFGFRGANWKLGQIRSGYPDYPLGRSAILRIVRRLIDHQCSFWSSSRSTRTTGDEMFNWPFVHLYRYAQGMELTDAQVAKLREYLLREGLPY